MADPITPDERAAIRESAESWDDVHPDDALRLLDALDTAEAEVARLRAEIRRDLARFDSPTRSTPAAPAPVWDEDTVTEAVTQAMFPHFFTDDRQPLRVFTETRSDAELWEAEREAARRKARQALAVVREHLPVRPDRETIAQMTFEAAGRDDWGVANELERDEWLAVTDAVLALWPGESRATVQAEALRDAADEWLADPDAVGDSPADYRNWLRARADRLEKGETR